MKKSKASKGEWSEALEIPLGKRTKLYRVLEILPGALSYLMIIMLFLLSWLSPLLGAIYLLAIISTTLMKAIGITFRTMQGYYMIKKAEKVDWLGRLNELKDPNTNLNKIEARLAAAKIPQKIYEEEFNFCEHHENLKAIADGRRKIISPNEIYQIVIMVAYNEGMETLVPTVEAVKRSTFDKKRIIFVFAYEERGGEIMEIQARELERKFEHDFYKFMIVKHPANLKNEVVGKGPNLSYAGEAVYKYVKKEGIDEEKVIVTSLDSDNRMDPQYLACVAYEFAVREERQNLSYQPVSLFMNNIWDAPAPMRVIAISNSFFNVITSMRPHTLRNFASHSQPLKALVGMNFWSRRTIVEDGHQFWRSLFYFKGEYEALSIKVPIYQDAVMEETLGKTLKAQFIQLRRWDYGASDVAYVGEKLFSKKKRVMPFWQLLPKFARLLDGHVTLAAMAPIVTFGGWVPLLMNRHSRVVLTHNLPNMMSTIQLIASVGLMLTILLSLKMVPKRPKQYSFWRSLSMILQWLLIPVVSIIYQSITAFYSQTRLMLGKYMEKFDVTKKVVKKA